MAALFGTAVRICPGLGTLGPSGSTGWSGAVWLSANDLPTNAGSRHHGAALKSNKLEKTLLIGLEFAIACRAIQLAVPDEKGQKRIAAAEFSAANAKNLSVDLIGNELVRQILLDCLLMQIANGGIDRNFIELFAKKVIAIFGSSDAVDAMMRAVSERSDEPPTGRAESLAWGISVPAKEVYEDPAIRFGRDMMIMAHLPHSLGRKTLTSGTLLRIGEGWMFVLDRQRFRLRNPEKHAPAIEAAITEISTKGLSAAAELLLIVAESVNHRFADPWMEHLRVLRGDAKS